MNARMLRRFIILMALLLVVMMVGTHAYKSFMQRPPGDFETEMGDNRLTDRKYDEALEHFNKALREMPDHRGALMGRAIVFIQTERYPEAIAELTYLIDFLNKSLADDDSTGKGALAAAYANRGIVHDRQGRYEAALKDYIMALKTDEDTVDEPGVIHKILYGNPNPSSTRKRAQYIYEQLQKPPHERLMRVPELDEKQRMRKP
ncbi:MAG: tetratricopeptide repeat protein [Alphaproteobacteria bacterium]|nr:tetratricopeptide repeat protein [Alphaproteobacteria bacterium]